MMNKQQFTKHYTTIYGTKDLATQITNKKLEIINSGRVDNSNFSRATCSSIFNEKKPNSNSTNNSA